MKLKYKGRKEKLEIRIAHELAAKKPDIKKIMSAVEMFEKDNLDTIEKLKRPRTNDTKRISGALKSAIAAHGPITKILIGSATKRVYGSLLDSPSKPTETKLSALNIERQVLRILAYGGIILVLIKFATQLLN